MNQLNLTITHFKWTVDYYHWPSRSFTQQAIKCDVLRFLILSKGVL